MSRLQTRFLALVAAQAVHSMEEYLGRLWEVFPPATFLTGLISDNHEVGFLVANIGFVLFGVWVFIWPVRKYWSSARTLIWVWVAIELINGIGHLAWAIWQGAYMPGVITAPVLFVVALLLLQQLRAQSSAAGEQATSP